jgi:hypothetical protein
MRVYDHRGLVKALYSPSNISPDFLRQTEQLDSNDDDSACIREVSGSNLAARTPTVLPEVFIVPPPVPPCKFLECHTLHHGHFLPHPLRDSLFVPFDAFFFKLVI